MTTSYYAPPSAFRGDRVVLPEEEAVHAVRVLRQRPGDVIRVVDGAGGTHRVRLEQVDKRGAAGLLLETEPEVGEPPCRVSIGLALLKQINRFEFFLEKAVELGVTEIVPLVTYRTEKIRLKAARAEHILIAALKQSGRSRLPRLREPVPLAALWQEAASFQERFICHEAASPGQGLGGRLFGAPNVESVSVLVGPEGGFTDEEIAAAVEAGWSVASLGPRRLRAETAALVAAAAALLNREAAGGALSRKTLEKPEINRG